MDIELKRAPGGMAEANVRHQCTRGMCHSPTGFEWGYAGSGPADLAFNILLGLGVPIVRAWRLHQEFKRAFLVGMPREGGTIREAEILWWVKENTDDRSAE